MAATKRSRNPSKNKHPPDRRGMLNIYQKRMLSLIFIPVPLFFLWLWSSIIFVFHAICFPAVNFITWLVVAVHFVSAIEVLADTCVNHVTESNVECVCAVSSVLDLVSSVVDTTDREVHANAATEVNTQCRVETYVNAIVFVSCRIAFVSVVTACVIEIELAIPEESFALADIMRVACKWTYPVQVISIFYTSAVLSSVLTPHDRKT